MRVNAKVNFSNLSGAMENRMFSQVRKPLRRILMTADAIGGVWTYAIELAKEYKKRNIEVVMVVMGGISDQNLKNDIQKYENIELIESKYKLEWMENPWDDVDKAGEWLLELEMLFNPDIIHLNGYTHAALVWNRPVLVAAHSCVCSWFDNVKGTEIPDEYREYKKRVIEGLACADHVVAPSYDMLKNINKHYGPVKQSTVIYNGNSLLNGFKTKKEKFVLTAGRIWDEGKNIESLARIASQLDWEVYAAGEGDVKGTKYKNFKTLGKISQSELFAYMLKAPIFVLPSKYEPFGLSILEAARAGCALVLGDIPSLREIWESDAVFVDPLDDGQIRKTIQYLITNESLRNEFGMRAKKRAQKYSAEKMAFNYIKVYDSLLCQKAVRDTSNR